MYPIDNIFLLFSVFVLMYVLGLRILGNVYFSDKPNSRKIHKSPIPLLGGIIFGPIFLLFSYLLELLPNWYMICAIITIILGFLDDAINLKWQVKLIVQLIILIFLSEIFWDRITSVTYFIYNFELSNFNLFVIFVIWFIGIYNAVNLIDGMDGLATGYVLLVTLLGLSVSQTEYYDIHLILFLLLLSYIIFNQRPAKIFMGDSGSLLLGFHLAVMPLLYFDLTKNSNELIMTPFVLVISFLVADTSRVFLTRIISGKNPMDADTIHFHHIILKSSGSYLSTLTMIFVLTLLSVIGGILSLNENLGELFMLGHLLLIFLFILIPPLPSYLPLLNKIIDHLYKLQIQKKIEYQSNIRTAIICIQIILLLFFLMNSLELNLLFNYSNMVGALLLSTIIYFNRKDIISMYIILIGITILLHQSFSFVPELEVGPFQKLIIFSLSITLLIFSLQNKEGTYINQLSALDILLLLVGITMIVTGIIGYNNDLWLWIQIVNIWFGISFVLRRLFFSKNVI